jgi:hypothetical protein
MRRAFWLLPLLAGLAGWLFARRSGRVALPGAVTRTLEPARAKARPVETTTIPQADDKALGPKRTRYPWGQHPD